MEALLAATDPGTTLLSPYSSPTRCPVLIEGRMRTGPEGDRLDTEGWEGLLVGSAYGATPVLGDVRY
eukprot:1182818-Rhodomonas_salina.10